MHPIPTHERTSSATRLPDWERDFVFHYAADYYDRGWSVIPLAGKRPALASWREFQSRRAGLDQLRQWFGKTPANIGIATGRLSGLVVVDCDTADDARFWQQHYPRTPLVVHTGGGGAHFYYRHPSGDAIGNRVKLGSRRIDLRGEGGYVVAPPSRHPNGNHYRWAVETEYCLDEVPFFSAAWIGDETPVPAQRFAGRRNVQQPRSYIRSIRAISGQGGHNQTFRAACILRDAGLSPEEALCELMLWNETHALPPWSARELLHKVQSAFQMAGSSRKAGTSDE